MTHSKQYQDLYDHITREKRKSDRDDKASARTMGNAKPDKAQTIKKILESALLLAAIALILGGCLAIAAATFSAIWNNAGVVATHILAMVLAVFGYRECLRYSEVKKNRAREKQKADLAKREALQRELEEAKAQRDHAIAETAAKADEAAERARQLQVAQEIEKEHERE